MYQFKIHSTKLAAMIFIIAAVYYTISTGTYPIFTRGEGREAIVVQAMTNSNSYVLPLRNGIDIPSKPPLFHWIAAAISSIGSDEISGFDIRSPSAICASLALALIFLFIFRASSNEALAIPSIFLLASSLEWMRGASNARVDMTFSTFFSLSCFSLFVLINRQKSNSISRLIAFTSVATVSLLLSGLAKGPAGIILPLAICTAYLALIYFKERAFKPLLPAIYLISICTILSSVGLAIWYYLAYLEHGQKFLQVQLYDENLARLLHLKTSGAYSESLGHKKPFYFSPLYLFVGFLPWSIFLPSYLESLYYRIKSNQLFEDRLYLFCLIWVSAFLVAITISSSKRSVYFLPSYPALAYLLAFELRTSTKLKIFTLSKAALILKILSAIILLALTTLIVAINIEPLLDLIFTHTKINPLIKLYVEESHRHLVIALIFLLLWTFFIYRLSKLIKPNRIYQGVGLITICLLAISMIVGRSVNPFLSKIYSPRQFISEILPIIQEEPLYQYRETFYSSIFYTRRPIKQITDLAQLPKQNCYLLANEKDINEIKSKRNFSIIAISNNLAANKSAKLALLKFEDN